MQLPGLSVETVVYCNKSGMVSSYLIERTLKENCYFVGRVLSRFKIRKNIFQRQSIFSTNSFRQKTSLAKFQLLNNLD